MSLWDIMNKFQCEKLASSINDLKDIEVAIDLLDMAKHALPLEHKGKMDNLGVAQLPQNVKDICYANLQKAIPVFKELELDSAIDRCALFENCLNTKPTINEISIQARVLREAIQCDLKRRIFAFIPPAKAKTLEKIEEHWAIVWDRFPEVKEDTREAVYCYALGRNTACIFHAMRVAEIGLRLLCRKFRPKEKLKKPIEYAEWGIILGIIDTAMKAEIKKPNSPTRQARLEFFSKTANKCEYMNNLWRREVSHARKRKPFDEFDAIQALTNVQELMEVLAKKWPHKRELQGD
jgi:hypothetical protein